MSPFTIKKSGSRRSWFSEERTSGPVATQPVPNLTPDLGTRFRLREQLGCGGMGAVYRAYDRELGHEVALKVLHRLTAQDRLRLKGEFRALADIVHPNLVNLHELIVDERSCFFTMELVRGGDFVHYVRKVPLTTPEGQQRLRETARQLALALHALHEGGKLHRDVKPSNVLVTEAGRVVLLDFGLMAPVAQGADTASTDGLVGTVHYMAPEQAWGGTLTAATDWYGFGVTLYEAITGELPILGRPFEIAMKKRDYVPSSLRRRGFELPEDLDGLLLGLLQPEAAARPNAESIVTCMGGDLGRISLGPASASDPASNLFVDREDERRALHESFAAARAGNTAIIHVSGSSGIGKSALLKVFLADLRESSDALVLTSRCHPQEAVAFNAVDGLVDGLARYLDKRRELVDALVPEHVGALVRVFPALGRALGAAGEDWPSDADQSGQKLRRWAFGALRELLDRLGRQRPIVLFLDDVQWADEDSGVVLRDVLRPPNGARLLLILAYRAEDREKSGCLRVLDGDGREPVFPAEWLRYVTLGPLDDTLSSQVVRELIGPTWPGNDVQLDGFVREAAGSPFFLCELARYLRSEGENALTAERVGLDGMLRLRTSGLPPEARGVLEIFAVAGAPLDQQVALRAAGLPDTQRGLITSLERLSILRTTDAHQRTSEVYHHRIRDEVLRQLPPGRREGHHRAIATALLGTSHPNPLVAVEHFEAAGDQESVRRYIVAAANHASKALAFDRAARLYERAIEFGAAEVEPYELYQRLAEALANAQRGKESGNAFLRAADAIETRGHGDPEHVVFLRQQAAQQFIQTGHYEQGMQALHAVLSHLEIPFPRSRAEALGKATLLRVSSMARGVRLPTSTRQPSPQELRRFDALWNTNLRLGMVDHTLISYATVRCALDAVAMGEPSRMICALAFEAANSGTLSAGPFQRRADRLLELSESLCEKHAAPYDRAFLSFCRGIVACFRGEFLGSLESHEHALKTLREASKGAHWDLYLFEMWAIIALAHLGRIPELVRRVHAAHEDALARDDRFAARNASLGRPTTAWLCEDRPEYALEQADLALSWAPPQYTTQHYQHYICCVEAELYLGRNAQAWKRSLTEWPLLKQHFFLMLGFVRDELAQARARAALGRAAELRRQARAGGSAENAAELERVAEKDARTMEGHGLDCSKAWALLVRAGVHHLHGKRARAVECLRNALDAFERCQMQLYREAARHRLGELRGGEEGAKLVAAADGWMRAQGIVNPTALLRMLAPGFD